VCRSLIGALLFMEKAICTNCKNEKTLDQFQKDKSKRMGVTSWCKACTSEKRKGCPILAERRKTARLNDPQRLRGHNKKSYDKTKHVKWDSKRKRRANDDFYRLKENLRSRVRGFLNRSRPYGKDSYTHELLGADYATVYSHIEALFVDGMSWDLVGKEIHIDHIVPLASATNKEEAIKLFHYTNLQPLWAADNIRKGDKCV